MQELRFQISEVDPILLLGANNVKLKYIGEYFSQLKISSRGEIITVKGEEEIIKVFAKKLQQFVAFVQKYGQLTENNIDTWMVEDSQEVLSGNGSEILLHGVGGNKIKARTFNQRNLVDAVNTKDMVFAVGPAGTGKTYTAVACAVRALKNKEVKRIILTRPAVEAGENLGFLPGDLKDKLDPYMMPLYDALRDMIPTEKLMDYMDAGVVEIAPLAFMRGRTLDKAFVILDEAQNTTVNQMRMFLTRMGMHAKFVITGDISQIDLPHKQKSGLIYAIDLLKKIKGIGIVRLTQNDVIRHKLVKRIIQVFEEEKQVQNKNGEH